MEPPVTPSLRDAVGNLCLGLSRYGEANETRINTDSRCTHRTGGVFLHLDAGGSATEHGDRCGNAETRQARSEVDTAAQSARGRRGNSHSRKARSGVFSEIGVANTMHVVVAAGSSKLGSRVPRVSACLPPSPIFKSPSKPLRWRAETQMLAS